MPAQEFVTVDGRQYVTHDAVRLGLIPPPGDEVADVRTPPALRPAHSASKQDWVDYIVTISDSPSAQVSTWTRKELIAFANAWAGVPLEQTDD